MTASQAPWYAESASQILQHVKHAIRNKYAFPGGYRLNIVMSDGELCCTECSRREFKNICQSTIEPAYGRGWAALGIEIYWEGPDLACVQCGAAIESEYGDPEASESDA